MSEVFRDISSIDKMPSHVETPSRIFGRTVGKTTFRSGLLPQDRDSLNPMFGSSNYPENLPNQRFKSSSSAQSSALGLQSRLNQDSKIGTLMQKSSTSRTFGLQAANQPMAASCSSENNFSHLDMNNRHNKSTVSTVSRTFGLVSEDLNGVNSDNDDILHPELRRINSVNSSLMPRTFGLQTRNLTLHSRFFSENNLRDPHLDVMTYRRSNLSTVSRTFNLGAEKVIGGGLSGQDNEGFIQDLKRNGNVNSSVVPRPFGYPSTRNLTVHSSLLSEGNSNFRSNGISTGFKSFGLGVRGSTLMGGSRVQDSGKYNETIDDGGFRRPTLSRAIRGRNSLLSSRLFHSQNVDRHCKDLSNINGFNVSHISRRDMESMSESRLALNVKGNWMENQSVAGSVMSAVSMKAQFMNLLENLHHSILNIGPHVTAEAVRMEFDKAKQGLENISEMSFAPSVREPDAASIISQSSKYTCPPLNEPAAAESVICGGSLHLKSSKEVLKVLIPNKGGYRSKLSTHAEEEGGGGGGGRGKVTSVTPTKDSDDEEVSRFLFKKPKARAKRRKSSQSKRIKASEAVKNSSSATANRVISLKQWYPIALGSDLALCGIDEEGGAVKTDPVKKRLNKRSVQLMSGLVCNLIGSPSPMVSVLPEKIGTLLKNGLTDRWRVLQRELLNCQTAEKQHGKRKSKSPQRGASSPIKSGTSSPKKTPAKTPKAKAAKGKQKSAKVTCVPRQLTMKSPGGKKGKAIIPEKSISPKKRGTGAILTRSGRAVKPPAMFWLKFGSDEVTSSLESATPETTSARESPNKKNKKKYKTNETPARETRKAAVESPKKQHRKGGEKSRHTSPEKTKKAISPPSRRESKRKPAKVKESEEKESDEENRVHSSTEVVKRQTKTRQSHSKRKREPAGDIDSVKTKKSKLEQKMEVEVESTVEDVEPATKKKKPKKGGLGKPAQSRKPREKKPSPEKKGKKASKKRTTKEVEEEEEEAVDRKEVNELEGDFELQLEDIEIPEIANMSGNPQLSRSQLRMVSMETPPLKYFNNNLRLLRSATPMRSPDWCISQRTESEVKRFQKRREEAFKKKTRVNVKKTIVTETKTRKMVQSKDLKRVMEWVSEKTVKSPIWNSKVLQYIIPSRKQLEREDDDDDDDGEEENEDEEAVEDGIAEAELFKPSFV